MDLDQQDSSGSLPTIPIDQDQQESVIEDEFQWRSSSLAFPIKARQQFSMDQLINLTPGSILVAQEEQIGNSWHDHRSGALFSTASTVGFQWFTLKFVRSQKFYFSDLNKQAPEEVKALVLGYHWTIRTNMLTYEAQCLSHETRSRAKDEVIGMFSGNLIIGTRGAADAVVLMKLMTKDELGWICFVKHPNYTYLELQ